MIGGLAPLHWIIIIVAVVVIFGSRGKISSIMGDAAKGIRAFKDGLKGDDEANHVPPPGVLPHAEAEKDDVRR